MHARVERILPALTAQQAGSIFPIVGDAAMTPQTPADLLGKAASIHAAIRDGLPHEPDGDLLGYTTPNVSPPEQVVSRPAPRRRKARA